MKSIFRKIAFVLALAMVVTLFPVMSASAAVKDNKYVRTRNATLFVGGDANGNYESCWATGKKAKALVKEDGYKSAYTTDDKDGKIVSVSKYGEVTAVGIGKATVTATFTKKGEKDIVESFDVTVKKNAVNVAFEEELQNKLTEGLTVGDKITFKAVQTSADGENDVTDAAKFTVTDSEGEVKKFNENDEYEAVKAGKITVTVRSWQWAWDWTAEKNVSTPTTEEVSIEVEVKEALPTVTAVKQVSVTKLELSVENVTDEDLKNFKITNEFGTDVKVFWTEPKLSEDKKTLTVERYTSMVNGEKAKFAFADGEAFEFTAEIGELDRIALVGPGTVVVGKETDLEVKFLDKKGVELAVPTNGDLTFTAVDNTNTYVKFNDTKPNTITIWQVGQTVKVEATYYMGLDANWNRIEKKADTPLTITCVDDSAATAKDIQFSFASDKDFKSTTATDPLRLRVKGDEGKRLYAKVNRSYGDAVDSNSYSWYFEFSTLDPTVLLVSSDGTLTALREGTARISVRCNYGGANITGIAVIQVVPESKAASVEVDKRNVTISNKTNVEQETFSFTTKDQYGDKTSVQTIKKVEKIAGPGLTSENVSNFGVTTNGNKLTVTGCEQVSGTYTYRVTMEGDVSTVISVVVNKSDKTNIADAFSFRIVPVLGGSNEITFDALGDSFTPALYQFRIVAVDNRGVAFATVSSTTSGSSVTVSDVTIQSGNTKWYENLVPDANGIYSVQFATSTTSSGSAITINNSGTDYLVKEGNFTISAKCKIGTNERTTIALTGKSSVKRSDLTVSANTRDISVTGAGSDAVKAAIQNQLKTNDDNKFTIVGIDTANDDIVRGTGYVLLKSVTVREKTETGYVVHTYNMNVTFTVRVNQ